MLDAARPYTTPCGLLKQPDKQKIFRSNSKDPALQELVEIRRDLANSLGIWVSAKLKSV
jgi:hypothetical protein